MLALRERRLRNATGLVYQTLSEQAFPTRVETNGMARLDSRSQERVAERHRLRGSASLSGVDSFDQIFQNLLGRLIRGVDDQGIVRGP